MDSSAPKDAITETPAPSVVDQITATPPPPPAPLPDLPPLAVTRGHPVALALLFFVEMWERFSYYGMRAMLVLYLREALSSPNPGRGWTQSEASVLYGWYTGLAYLLPLGGGYLADRFLGTHRSVVLGSIIIALGHVALAVSGLGHLATSDSGMAIFIGGLALIIIGTGYFKPCMAVMVSQLYPPNDPRRDGAYTIFYMGVNLGAFLAPLGCSALGEIFGWHWGFGAAAVGMICGLIFYLIGRPFFLKGIGEAPPNRPNLSGVLFVVSLFAAVAVAGLYDVGGFRMFVDAVKRLWHDPYIGPITSAVLTIGCLVASVWFIAIQHPGDKGPTFCIFVFMLFNVFFWIAYEQAGTTLNVFAKDSTNRDLLGYEVPATAFQSINAFAILAFGPLFIILWTALGRRGLDPSQPVKIALGLILLGLGYLFMVAAAQLNATGVQVSMLWLTATYIVHTLGELCLSPTGLSFVTKAAPARFVTLLMGFWFISSFLANLGSGIIASYVDDIEAGKVELFWYPWFKLGGKADFFLMFVISSIGAGVLILVLTPLLKKLLHGRG